MNLIYWLVARGPQAVTAQNRTGSFRGILFHTRSIDRCRCNRQSIIESSNQSIRNDVSNSRRILFHVLIQTVRSHVWRVSRIPSPCLDRNRPRPLLTTIDRSITIDTVFCSRSRQTTISPWAASLRDCDRYFVSTCCGERSPVNARACVEYRALIRH